MLSVFGPMLDNESLVTMMQHLIRKMDEMRAVDEDVDEHVVVQISSKALGIIFELLAARPKTAASVTENVEALLTLWRRSPSPAIDNVLLVVVSGALPLLFSDASTTAYSHSMGQANIFPRQPLRLPIQPSRKDIQILLSDSSSARLEILALACAVDLNVRRLTAEIILANVQSLQHTVTDSQQFTRRYLQLLCTLPDTPTCTVRWYHHVTETEQQAAIALADKCLRTMLASRLADMSQANFAAQLLPFLSTNQLKHITSMLMTRLHEKYDEQILYLVQSLLHRYAHYTSPPNVVSQLIDATFTSLLTCPNTTHHTDATYEQAGKYRMNVSEFIITCPLAIFLQRCHALNWPFDANQLTALFDAALARVLHQSSVLHLIKAILQVSTTEASVYTFNFPIMKRLTSI
jgi:hypothetical protein